MIDIDRRGSIAVLTMAHGKANAMDLELCEAIADRFEECRQPWCAAVVVTGRGSIFSAGVDLVRVIDEGEPYVRRFLPALNRAFEAAFTFMKPMVAAVNGHAIAGGCILALCADRRLMSQGSATIGIPELVVGVPFPPVPIEVIRYAVAARYAHALTLGGAVLTPDAAIQQGVLDEVVDAAALLPRAIEAAETLASRPSPAFAITKRQLREPAIERMTAGKVRFDREVEDLWCAPATFDAIRAYISRTFKKPGG